MKNYEEIADSIIKKYEQRLAERKRRKDIIMRSAALGLGAAAIIGVGICANALKPPKKPTANNSGIITNTTEAVTTSAERSVQTSAKSVTTRKQSTVTTSVTTETATSKSTSATPEKTTERMTAEVTTTLQTTAVTVVTSVSKTYQTSIVTSAAATTCETDITESPELPTGTDKTTAPMIGTSFPVSTVETTTVTSTENPEIPSYDDMLAENFKTIELSKRAVLVSKDYCVSEQQVSSYLNDIILIPELYTDDLPPEITAHIYELVKRTSNYGAVKFQDSDKYWVYERVKRTITVQNQ